MTKGSNEHDRTGEGVSPDSESGRPADLMRASERLEEEDAERKRADERVRKLNRLLKTISEVSQLIVREPDRDRLLQEACRVLVEHGQYHSAWIGMADFTTGKVRPAAQCGFEDGFLNTIDVRWDESGQVRWPTGTAISSGKPVVCNDVEKEDAFAPLLEEARTRGYRAFASFPVSAGGKVVSAVNVFSKTPEAFDRENVALLLEMAADIGYALQNLAEAEERKRGEESLRQSEERFRSAFDDAPIGMELVALDGRFVRVNRAVCDILGYTEQELLAKDFQSVTHPDDLSLHLENIEGLLAGRFKAFDMEKRYIHKRGHAVWVLLSASLMRDTAGNPLYVIGQVQDITEHKRSEAALKEGEGRLRELNRLYKTISEISKLVVREPDRDRLIQEACHILVEDGQFHSAWIGMADFTTGEVRPAAQCGFDDGFLNKINVHWDESGQVRWPVGTAISTGKPVICNDYETDEEFAPWREEAVQRGYRASASIPISAGGKVICALNVFSKTPDAFDRERVAPLIEMSADIGYALQNLAETEERKRGEESLRENEERFRHAFDDAPNGMHLVALNGRFIRANRVVCNILGYTEQELLAKDFQSITHPDDLSMDLDNVKELLAGKFETFEVEKRYIHKSERVVWILASVSLVRDDEGQPLHIVSQVRDITEQKRLAGEMVRLKQAVDNSGEIIFMTNGEGTFTFVNPEFTRLYGYTSEEVVGKCTPRILKSGRHTQDEYRDFWSSILKKQVVRREFNNKTKDGHQVTVDASANPILDDKGVAGFLAVQRDITERKRAEVEKEKLEAHLVLAQKMEAIGTLAGGVAHDFNNVLTAIQGYTDLSLMKVSEDDPLRHNLTEVRKASERAANLTRQLLLFSQRQAVIKRPMDMNKIVTDLIKMLGRIVGESFSIETHLQADLWTVKADSGQIEQVIMNLAVNARDAMPGGGEIVIMTENVDVEEESHRQGPNARSGQFACLTVIDKGTGMDKGTLSRIFEPFFTTKERSKGTGLGLAVVHGIVQKHDGWIDVESEPGKGSTFRVFIPAVAEKVQEEGPRAPTAEERAGQGERILLVEDESTIRALAEKLLTENGYEVFAFDTVKGAMDAFERDGGNFDLVFSDIGLPDGSGVELVERISAKKPGIRALLASGYASDASGLAAAQERGIAFLQKPYSLPDVLRTVRGLLDGR